MPPARSTRISDRQWDDVQTRIKQLVHQHVPLSCKDGSRVTIPEILQRENNLDITVSQLEAKLKEWNVAKNLRLREWQVIMPWLDELEDNGTEYQVLLAGKEIKKTAIRRARRRLKQKSHDDALLGSTVPIIETREISIKIREHDSWIPFRQIAAPMGANAALDEVGTGTQEQNRDPRTPIPDTSLSAPNNQPTTSPSHTRTRNSQLVLRSASTTQASVYAAPESGRTPLSDLFQAALPDPQDRSAGGDDYFSLDQPLSIGPVSPGFGIFDPWANILSPAQGTLDFWTDVEGIHVVQQSPLTTPLTTATAALTRYTQTSASILPTEMPANSYDLLRGMLQHAADARMSAIPDEDSLSEDESDDESEDDDPEQLPALPEVDELCDRLLGLTPREEVDNTFCCADEVTNPGSTIRMALVHSIINNFAGLRGLPAKSILWALKNDVKLRSALFRRLHESSAALAKTVTNNLFRAAVVARDAETAKLIIEAGKGRTYAICLEEVSWIPDLPRTTPLAEAVYAQNNQLAKIFEGLGAWSLVENCKDHFAALISAAAAVGDLRSLKRALGLRAHMNRVMSHNALMEAIRNKQTEATLILLDEGVKPSEEHLLEALMIRNKEIVDTILDSDIRFTDRRHSDHRAMEEAGKWGDISVIKNLTFMGFNLNYGHETTVLIEAVKLKNKELVVFLLNSGANPNIQPAFGNTCSPLGEAIGIESEEMVDLLLSKGANPANEKAFLNATRTGHPCLGRLLGTFRETYPLGLPGFGMESLIKAMRNNEVDVLRSLLLAGFDPNSLGTDLATPLGFAIHESANIEFVVQLLDSGADVGRVAIIHGSSFSEHSDSESHLYPALLVAVNSGRDAIANLLLDRGADVNQPARLGVKRTPLQAACEIGSWKMVRLLLQRGADVGAPPARSGGGTALQMAAKEGHVRIVQLLLSLGATVHEVPSRVLGRSALEGAAENGRLRMLGVLWTAGQSASGGFPDEEIMSAIKYANQKGHKGCADYLAWLWATQSAATRGISEEVHDSGTEEAHGDQGRG
ncbi:hypothetical protein MCOR02_007834 [Pyricularia oryzae]|nr:hypothetical protein MCOR02_007834 [Pyricularia oryzae]KAI6329091.1 hypothetical protein MCOR30_005821 [Pyricularia oryzae]KAI6341474.1 hypothetical protein MCOR28_006002 [Pyricularia oryzae]KAI6367930.1 hypothetical protein MCOR32_007037 [Pyricularia oryzae]KAI6420212.1 hypothetical protein MCOR21_009878 [Pyricularia oryzae]